MSIGNVGNNIGNNIGNIQYNNAPAPPKKRKASVKNIEETIPIEKYNMLYTEYMMLKAKYDALQHSYDACQELMKTMRTIIEAKNDLIKMLQENRKV